MPRRILEPGTSPQEPQPTVDPETNMYEHNGIEVVNDFKTVDSEAFMAQKVKILLAKKSTDKLYALVSPCVNGVYQHIFIGIPQVVARKYVEVLIRSHEVDYDYEVEANKAILEGERPTASTTPSHPLEILEDTVEGYQWYDRMLKQNAFL